MEREGEHVASSAVMEYDEFEEVIARIANEKQVVEDEGDGKGEGKMKVTPAGSTGVSSSWIGSEKGLGDMVVRFVKSLAWMVAAPPK